MTDVYEDRVGAATVGGGTVRNIRFADDTDGLGGEMQELTNRVDRLNKTSASYEMKISAGKTKLMTIYQHQRHHWG